MEDTPANAMVLEALLRCLERRQPGLAADIMDEMASMLTTLEREHAPKASDADEAILAWGRRLQAVSNDIADESLARR
jgi:hypothetical protein